MFGPNTQVSVTGTAEQDYLKSGVTLNSWPRLTKRTRSRKRSSKLIIVTPTTDRPLGLCPHGICHSGQEGRKGRGEKAKPLRARSRLGDVPPAKAHGKKAPIRKAAICSPASPARAAPCKPPGTFTVRGTIKLCKDGKITVAAGRGPTIKAELASDVKIDVDMADIRAAQRDDRVTVDGKTTQARPNLVMAESIKIDLANPLSGAKKHATRPAKTPAAKTTAKAKKGDPPTADDLLGGGK